MAGEVKKDKPIKPLSGSPEIKNQCKATFTFNIGLPNTPFVRFRCMREKHEDGLHEHHGISGKGWDYRVCWDEPKYAHLKVEEELFTGKESTREQ